MIPITLLFALTVQDPATAISVIGQVEVDTGKNMIALQRFDEVDEGTTIITHDDSFATLRLPSGSQLRLAPNTQVRLGTVTLRQPASNRTTKLKLKVGRIWAGVMGLFGNEASFEVTTTNAVAGVRGTAFWAAVDGQGERFVVDHGSLKIGLGDTSLALDGPGAVADITGGRLQPLSRMSRLDVAALRNLTGGPGASLHYRFNSNVGRSLTPFASTRKSPSFAAPDIVKDGPLGVASVSDQLRGGADIIVRVIPPTE